MATIPLIAYSRQCKTTQGGIRKVYLFPYTQHAPSEIVFVGMQLESYPATEIFEFLCEGTYGQTSSAEGGAYFFDQNVSIDLPKVYGFLNIADYLRQDLCAIVLTNNNDLLLAGAFNGLTGTVDNNDGGAKESFNGFKITLNGREETPLLFIANLVDAGFVPNTEYTQRLLLQADGSYILLQDTEFIKY